MRSRIIGVTVLLLCFASGMALGSSNEEQFVGATSTRPAKSWPGAFLSGNGRMGVMMFGEPYKETVVLNHCKLYLPMGNREIVHDLSRSMPAFKKAGLAAGIRGPAVVHEMMLKKIGHKIVGTDPFHPAFMLKLDMALQSDAYQKYRTQPQELLASLPHDGNAVGHERHMAQITRLGLNT